MAIGFRVLFMNTTGSHLTGIGAAALRNNTTASFNTAIGADALRENTTGENNTAIGADALRSNTTAPTTPPPVVWRSIATQPATSTRLTVFRHSIATQLASAIPPRVVMRLFPIPPAAATQPSVRVRSLPTQSATSISRWALLPVTLAPQAINNIDIGNTSAAAARIQHYPHRQLLAHGTRYIAGILGNGPFSCGVSIDSVTGQLGVGGCISSERFKKDIDSMDKASEAIFSLKPVTFHYKNDKTNIPQFGLIAEEVAKVNPDLIARGQRRKTLQRSLRRGERDVAQRVSQGAPQERRNSKRPSLS